MKKDIQPTVELFLFEPESSLMVEMSLNETEVKDSWTKKKDFDGGNSNPWSSNNWQTTNE